MTRSPSAKLGCLEATTLPMPPARITSPISTGAMYDLPSFIQPRIAGSSDRYRVFTSTPPSAGSATGSVVNCQFSRVVMPTGRTASRIWWFCREAKSVMWDSRGRRGWKGRCKCQETLCPDEVPMPWLVDDAVRVVARVAHDGSRNHRHARSARRRRACARRTPRPAAHQARRCPARCRCGVRCNRARR